MAIECLIIEDDKSVVDIIQAVGNDFDQTSFRHVGEEQETALNIILKIGKNASFSSKIFAIICAFPRSDLQFFMSVLKLQKHSNSIF